MQDCESCHLIKAQSEQERLSIDVCSATTNLLSWALLLIRSSRDGNMNCKSSLSTKLKGYLECLLLKCDHVLCEVGCIKTWEQQMGRSASRFSLPAFLPPPNAEDKSCCGIKDDPFGSLNGTRAWTDCADERIGSDCKETLTAFAPCGKFDDRHP